MIRFRAAWILPIARPPVADGWVDVDRGRVLNVADGVAPALQPLAPTDRVVDLGRVVVLPGLVNAHTHLELSSLGGRVPPAASMPEWVRALMAARQAGDESEVAPAMAAAITEARRAGTAIVGDISNTVSSYAALVASSLRGVVFHEVIKFNPADPEKLADRALERVRRLPPSDRVRFSLAAHAPYSVAPGLFRAVMRHLEQCNWPGCVHLAESSQELEFLREGTGAWRRLLDELGAWDPRWRVPACSPVEYLQGVGWMKANILLVHGVHLTRQELDTVAAAGATLVTCPRSNDWTGAGAPPVRDFFASGVRVAVGTDSLASVPDLNVFAELAALRRLAPEVPARRLIESATRSGAEALGFADSHGTIEPRRAADLIAVRVSEDVTDVEEYLVSGISPDQVMWLTQDL